MAKVVISHRLHDDGMAVLEKAGVEVVITNSGDPKVMLPELKDADGVIIRIGSIDRETMEQCPKLKVIGRPGVGVMMSMSKQQRNSEFPSSLPQGPIVVLLQNMRWQ